MRHNWTHTAGVERALRASRLGRLRWATLALALVATVVVGRAASGPAIPLAHLNAVSATAGAGGTSVTIETSEPVAYVATRPDPLTVMVELRNVTSTGVRNRLAGVAVGAVAAATIEDARAADGATVARVRLLLASPARHAVRSERALIHVNVEPEAGEANAPSTPPAAAASADVAATREVIGGPATTLESVRASAAAGGVELTLTGNGPLSATTAELTKAKPYRLVLDFPGITSQAPAVVPVGQGVVQRVRVGAHSLKPLVTRVVVDLSADAHYTLQPSGNDLKIAIVDAAQAPAQTAAQAPPKTTATKPAAKTPAVVPAKSKAASAPAKTPATPTVTDKPAAAKPAETPKPEPLPTAPAAKPADAPQAVPVPATVPQALATQGQQQAPKQYTGHPISLDFQGVDLRAVLRTFAEISGLNIVIDPNVQGTVDVALRDVPWDQALDTILRANKLGYLVDGTIVRIAPLNTLADEESQRRKLTEEQALSGELKVMTHALSYAKAADLRDILLKSALTKRAEVQVDNRSNTLIIRDLPPALETAKDLLEKLDKPQPQVEIEARVVQTTRDFARTIGVQWGVNGQMSQALGNTTNLAFPNTVSVSGRTGVTQGGTSDKATSTAVNLVNSTATSAIGVALGSVNGAFNLDLALSALEKSGHGRILSTPRVSTQNNQAAEMTQGVQIPIQTVANNTVTVSFKDAALKLLVTPQITASNTVIMTITIENASPDYSRAVGPNAIPPIDTQRAVTTVLVKDGETTVIGGIYVSQEQAATDRTPGVSRIPLLGWLFKRDSKTDQSRELLIFITPRIAKL